MQEKQPQTKKKANKDQMVRALYERGEEKMIEKTLILIKPDGVQRGLVGEITQRFEKVGLKITGMKMQWVDKEFAREHYKAHVDKPFYPGLEAMITEGPVVALVLEGVHAVEQVRKMVGPTEPKAAPPGTIRGDYAHVSHEHADKKGIAIKNLIRRKFFCDLIL